jgi:tetratricopeptide (TPR) repeat protein
MLLVCLLSFCAFVAQAQPSKQSQKASQAVPNKALNLPEPSPVEKELQKRVTPKLSKMDFRGALNEVTTMIVIDSANPTLYNVRATLNAQLYRFDEAAQDYSTIIRLQPNNLDALQSRAQLRYEHLKDVNGSLEDWTRVLAIDSLNPTAWYARAYIFQGQQKYEEARKDYTSSLRVGNAENVYALTQRGFCAMKLKQFNEAMSDFTAAIKAADSATGRTMLFDAFFYRGSLHLQRRKYPEAVFDLDAAVRLNDQSGEAYYLRGYAKMLAGRTEDGCVDVSQAKELRYQGAEDLIAKYCDVVPNLDSLRRYTLPTVTVTAGRSREEVAMTDSRRLLRRVQSIVANPSLRSEGLVPITNLSYQAPPGMISPFDCNKQRLEMMRPSQISVGCIAQVLQEELRTLKDATVRSLVDEIMNTANDLYVLESTSQPESSSLTQNTPNNPAQGLDQINANQMQLLRLRISEQFRELNTLLEKIQGTKK